MILSLGHFAIKNPAKWAFLMALISSILLIIFGLIDAKISFSKFDENAIFSGLVKLDETIFLVLATYIFIKFFTFFKAFSFLNLIFFALIFLIIFWLLYGFVDDFLVDFSFEICNQKLHLSYILLAGLNFIYILGLNLIPKKAF